MSAFTNKPQTTTVYSGLGFCQVLTIVFVVLKLIGVINWSWWWVLSPLWLPVVVIIAFIVIVGIIMAVTSKH